MVRGLLDTVNSKLLPKMGKTILNALATSLMFMSSLAISFAVAIIIAVALFVVAGFVVANPFSFSRA